MSAAGPVIDTAVSDGAAVVAAALASSVAATAEPSTPVARDTDAPQARRGTGTMSTRTHDAAGTADSADGAAAAADASAPAAGAPSSATGAPAAGSTATAAPAGVTAQPVDAAAATVTAAPAPAKTTATTQAPSRPAFGEAPSPAGSFGSTVFALLLVVGLILGLGWLARRMPGFGRGTTTTGLRVVTSMSIGARERLVVVEVGQTQLLVGVGAGGMRTLHTLDEPLAAAPAPTASPFAQLLAQQFGKKA